jgi:hypothetical protein
MLGDLGHDIPTSYFGMIDMRYPNDVNTKGLLQAAEDKTVARVKPAYHAVQHLAAVFDDRLRRVRDFRYQAGTQRPLSAFAYADTATGQQVVTVWFDGEGPTDRNAMTPVDLTVEGGRFRDPVWVDLRAGTVHRIPAGAWSRRGSTYVFRGVPVYDAPVLVADRSVIPLRAAAPPAGR